MKDVSGVRWSGPGALPGEKLPVVGLYGPAAGRHDQLAPTPDSFSLTPGSMPDSAPEEVPDAGLEQPQ
jgi:hypothetical protein